jgi:hypothetical protein
MGNLTHDVRIKVQVAGGRMRSFALLVAVAAINAAAVHGAAAEAKMRLAQTSTVTNCMMTCNAQAATCQSGCLVPVAPTTRPTSSGPTPAPNPSADTTCLMTCTSTQIACQTNCGRQSPSQ